MSNRFHNKWHRHNHHTYSHASGTEPDSSHDPIASEDDPFFGTFYLSGSLVAQAPASAFAVGGTSNFVGVSGWSNAGVGVQGHSKNVGVSGNGIWGVLGTGQQNGVLAASVERALITLANVETTLDSSTNFALSSDNNAKISGILYADLIMTPYLSAYNGNFDVMSAKDAFIDEGFVQYMSARDIFVHNLTAISAISYYQDVIFTETSGFDIVGSDFSKVVPPTEPLGDRLLLSGVGLSASSWVSILGNLQVDGELIADMNRTFTERVHGIEADVNTERYLFYSGNEGLTANTIQFVPDYDITASGGTTTFTLCAQPADTIIAEETVSSWTKGSGISMTISTSTVPANNYLVISTEGASAPFVETPDYLFILNYLQRNSS